MILTNKEKMQRVEIAKDIFYYAQMMKVMSINQKMLLKNIFKENEKQSGKKIYNDSRFEQIRKHHYFSIVIASFSFLKDEYIDKLKLKDIDIDEKLLTGIFVNPQDVDKYRNHNPGHNNKLQIFEIISYIRNALNHHENGILYKYIEEEDSIEINLKNVGKTDKGEIKTFHVKVPICTLMKIIHALDENENKQSKLLYVKGNMNENLTNLTGELKKNIGVLRLIPTKNVNHQELFKKIENTKMDDREKLVYELQKEGKLKIREYTYKNGAITDFMIESMNEQLFFDEDDWRINYMYDCLNYINLEKSNKSISETIKGNIAGYFSIRHMMPFSRVTNFRFIASAKFNQDCLTNLNDSYERVLRKKGTAYKDLSLLSEFDWFMLDPVEKIFTEYENFIRYVIVNFAPASKDNEPVYIDFAGKKYNCTFLRNAFAHGRVGYTKKEDQYMFILYDTKNGLNNEVTFSKNEDFKPKMFTLTELIKLALHLCINEKKTIESESSKEIQNLNKLKIELLNNQNLLFQSPIKMKQPKLLKRSHMHKK